MHYSVLFSGTLRVRRESHTEPFLLMPFLAGVVGGTEHGWKAKLRTIKLKNNTGKATGNNQEVSVRCKCQGLAGGLRAVLIHSGPPHALIRD